MSFNFENNRPIYLQVVEIILNRILTNIYPINSKIPSVRELANELKINPNTLQKSFSELEKLNIIKVQRTNGRFVTDDQNLINEIKEDLIKKYTLEYLNKLSELNYDINNAITLIQYLKEGAIEK